MRKRVACVLLSGGRREPLEAFAEACFRLSPQVAIREGEAVFVEIGASRALFSEASVELRLKALASRLLKGPVRVSICDTASTALASARFPAFARTRDLKALPLDALADYANPFLRDADLDKRVLRIRCILESLGVVSIGQFATLPRQSLASRLGKEALGLMAKVWGEMECAWPGFHPAPTIIERAETLDPEAHGLSHDLAGSLEVLHGLVDRAMARLRGRGERVSAMEIRFSPENRHWRMEFPLPQGSASGILPMLRDRLDHALSRSPLQGPVEAMEVEITETVPGAGTQRDFFSKKEEEREAWDGLVARLSQRLGKDRVFVAFPQERHLPERAFARRLVSVPSVASDATKRKPVAEWADRPARVLRKPEPLVKDGRLLRSGGRQWKAVSWEGPERLAGEWWRDPRHEGFNRDYYRVITECGAQLWVFQNRKAAAELPELYLHGYFD